MIEVQDLDRLAGEIMDSPHGAKAWCEKNGIDFEAVASAIAAALQGLGEELPSLEEHHPDASREELFLHGVTNGLGQMFRLGWETRNQYGVDSSGDPRDGS